MKFIKIKKPHLRYMKSKNFNEIADYLHRNPLIAWLFWKRLKTMLNLSKPAKRVLDFGSGSGVFLPSLSRNFVEVYAFDLDIESLEYVKKTYNLENVKIIKGVRGKNRLPYKNNFFDIIFAADVLEHFKDSLKIQEEFKRILKINGSLIVSGPTENFLYRLVRKYIYRQRKPKDHYTDIFDVMNKSKRLFKIEKIIILPCPLIPGFKIYRAKKV